MTRIWKELTTLSCYCCFDLQAAEEMVKYQLRHGNDLLAMDSLRACDVSTSCNKHGLVSVYFVPLVY